MRLTFQLITRHLFWLGFIACLIASCKRGSDIPEATYLEPHRPQLHFSPPTQWMNDPNGMVFFEGEYHLFYQYFPDSTVWGPMHWGHAVSTDLVHWEHLPIALEPDALGYIFSGSVVVDWQNTSGLGSEEHPPLVALFTYHNEKAKLKGAKNFQTQGMAYSTDKGRTWKKYAKNPVLPNKEDLVDFRDPKVVWDREFRRWIMTLAAGDHVRFYASKNLIDWQYMSSFGSQIGAHGGVWECPDLFQMVNEDSGELRWVLLVSINPGAPNGGSGTQYFVGRMVGNVYQLDAEFEFQLGRLPNSAPKARWIDYGRDNYAGVTWSDIPEEDGRRIFLGWMSNWDYAQVVPTHPWRSAMTLPRQLHLRSTPKGPLLTSTFAQELAVLRQDSLSVPIPDSITTAIMLPGQPQQVELVLEALVGLDSSSMVLELYNDAGEIYRLGYDQHTNSFFSDRTKAGNSDFSSKFADTLHTAPRFIDGSLLDLHIFIDKASIEVVADDGFTVITDNFFPNEDFTQWRLVFTGENWGMQRASVFTLKSIWHD